MKRGDRVLVPGFVLAAEDGVVTVEFAGTYPDNGQRIQIAAEAVEPQDLAAPRMTVICACGVSSPHCHCKSYAGPHRHPAGVVPS